ncbi:MAG: acyl-CoA thioesterase [Anaerolineales bacterium]|nr:acyl-CoA thioesterase [Anaerolineales bacterium]
MSEYRFFHSIEVRYADIDAQRHVNNANYFTYMEQARVKYVEHLDLWSGQDFDNFGFILAEQSCSYKSPITYLQRVRVGVRTARLGRKSFEMDYTFQDEGSEEELARGRTVLVAYDYRSGETIPIPANWRQVLMAYEGLT